MSTFRGSVQSVFGKKRFLSQYLVYYEIAHKYLFFVAYLLLILKYNALYRITRYRCCVNRWVKMGLFNIMHVTCKSYAGYLHS